MWIATSREISYRPSSSLSSLSGTKLLVKPTKQATQDTTLVPKKCHWKTRAVRVVSPFSVFPPPNELPKEMSPDSPLPTPAPWSEQTEDSIAVFGSLNRWDRWYTITQLAVYTTQKYHLYETLPPRWGQRKDFLFSPGKLGKMKPYFSKGLKPPTNATGK